MSLSLRTTILATGCVLAIGTSAARAQMPLVSYYYPRRATTPRRRGRSTSRPPATTTTCRSTPSRLRSTLSRPRGLPIPPSTIPRIRARLTPRQIVRPRGPPTPPLYYPRGGASTEGGGGPAYEGDERPSGAYVSGDNEDNPDW